MSRMDASCLPPQERPAIRTRVWAGTAGSDIMTEPNTGQVRVFLVM